MRNVIFTKPSSKTMRPPIYFRQFQALQTARTRDTSAGAALAILSRVQIRMRRERAAQLRYNNTSLLRSSTLTFRCNRALKVTHYSGKQFEISTTCHRHRRCTGRGKSFGPRIHTDIPARIRSMYARAAYFHHCLLRPSESRKALNISIVRAIESPNHSKLSMARRWRRSRFTDRSFR